METSKIKTQKPFKDLFRIYDKNYEDILKDMEENGYDPNEPVLIWKEENVLIDGHTRLEAAKELRIKEIPVNLLSFKNESKAICYSIRHNATKGRFVTTGDKLRLVRLIDNPQLQGGDHNPEGINQYTEVGQNKNFSFDLNSEESAKITAKLIGISSVQVNKMRTIITYGTEDDIEDVENDEISIDTAWKSAKEEKEKIKAEREAVKEFNRTTDSIEWALWTWNPITGCKHGCKYCYARDIAERLFKQGFEPTFHKARLTAPQNNKIPDIDEPGEHNVFVCSMADLFGDWIPDEQIEAVFASINNAPDWWNFLFLTKNPERYLELDFPEKCWIGATATNQEQMDRAIKVFEKLQKKVDNILFISCEPLMEKIKANLDYIDWLIIGGRSRTKGMEAGQPEWKWVEALILQAIKSKIPYYMKPNLEVRSKAYPK